MIKINVISNNIRWNSYLKNPNLYVGEKLKKINKKKNIFKKNIFHCTLLLSDESEIKRLNNKFRRKNKSTDVLSFPFYKKKELAKKLNIEKEIYIGDIIINLRKVKKKTSIKNFKIEFNKLWVHGFVHLFGYDHKNEKEFIKMNKIEKKILSVIN